MDHSLPVLLPKGFSRQKYWSGLQSSPPRYLLDPGMEPMSLASSALAGRFFTTSATWEACYFIIIFLIAHGSLLYFIGLDTLS